MSEITILVFFASMVQTPDYEGGHQPPLLLMCLLKPAGVGGW